MEVAVSTGAIRCAKPQSNYNYYRVLRVNVVSQSTAASSASCKRSRLPSNLVNGQELTMCDTVGISPQSHSPLSVKPHFLWHALWQCVNGLLSSVSISACSCSTCIGVQYATRYHRLLAAVRSRNTAPVFNCCWNPFSMWVVNAATCSQVLRFLRNPACSGLSSFST